MAVALSLLTAALPAAGQTLEEAVEHHLAGRFDEALVAYRAVAAATESSEPQVAAAAHTNACVILMNRSEYEQALATCEKALRLRRLSGDRARMARTLNNLGLTLQNLGRYRESKERYLEALEINREAGDPLSSAQNLSNLAAVAIQAGDYSEALERTTEVLALADAHPQADWADSQRRYALLNEGVVLEKLGAFRAALESYRRALALTGPIEDDLRAPLEVNLGVVYRNLGDPLRAIELFEAASDTYRRLGNVSGLSNARLNTALALHLNLDRPAEAESAYREALALAVDAGDRPEEIQDLFYLGSLLVERGRLDEATQLFERALEVSEASGSAEGRWSALAGLGRIAATHGRPGEAQDLFARAVDLIEEVRSELSADTHRAEFFGDKRSVFDSAVQAAADRHRDEPEAGHDATAFALVQRAKARELLDVLGPERVGRPLVWQEVGDVLGRARLIEFYLAERQLIRWSLDSSGLRMRALGPAAPYLEAATRVHRALSGGHAPRTDDLELLARSLLGELEPTAGPLYVAADGRLRYLPFELLPAATGTGATLLDDVPVSYLPSASALALLTTERERPELRAVGLANPEFEGGAPTSRPAALIAARFGLGPLPAAERELDTLERRLGGPTLLLRGATATESSLRAAVREGARVIHLATHTVIDERPGRGAAVLLAADGSDDGLLYPHEIAALDLGADLAVLAACRTALGSETDGNSLSTLTGAFLAAGANGVVATLWDVEDEVTASFMDQFYWQLGRGIEPAEALRRAKRTFRDRPGWDSPHLWAGYVLTGRSRPVVERTPLGLWLGGGLAALAAALFLLRRRRR